LYVVCCMLYVVCCMMYVCMCVCVYVVVVELMMEMLRIFLVVFEEDAQVFSFFYFKSLFKKGRICTRIYRRKSRLDNCR